MYTSCMPCYSTYPLWMQSEGKGGSKHAQRPSQQSRRQPAEECSPEPVCIQDARKEIDEQPGYSLKPAENRDMDEQQPDSLEEQDDRPQVECTDLESSAPVELAFINDEEVPEDDLDDDEPTLAEERTPERPDNTAKKKSEFLLQSMKQRNNYLL